jgi:hypothetical protein
LVHIAKAKNLKPDKIEKVNHRHHQHNLNLSLLSNIPYQGGGDYRGIYDTGFKRGAFMGYIGLLLNAPYKIDSMMGWDWDMVR